MVEVIKTEEGKMVDDSSWSKLKLEDLSTEKLLELARLQRVGSIQDFTNLIATLIKNEGHTVLEEKKDK